MASLRSAPCNLPPRRRSRRRLTRARPPAYFCEDFHKGCDVPRKISDSTVRRLSLYLRALETLEAEGGEPGGSDSVSSRDLAARAGTTAAQVRKDLSHFGSFGKRGMGYLVPELAARLRGILGLDRTWRVALVGAGRIGSALFEYADFRRRGFEIVQVFDVDREKVGRRWNGITILHGRLLEEKVREEDVEMAIIAVPADAAQEVVDRAVSAGVRGILNFAPARLRVPPEVVMEDVNIVMELEALSFALRREASPPVGEAS